MMITGFLNIVFAPLLALNPIITIFIMGLVVITTTNLLNKKFLGTENAKLLKKKMQEMREKMLSAQKIGDTKVVNECMKEIMKFNSQYFKFTLKPLVISMFIVILILPWLRANYSGNVLVSMPQLLPVVGGYEVSWFIWYIICTFSLSLVIRKIIGV